MPPSPKTSEPTVLETPFDDRTPKIEKVGYYFSQSSRGERSFKFFVAKGGVKDGDMFMYKKGILWRIRK